MSKNLTGLKALHEAAKPYHEFVEITDPARTKANAGFFLAAYESFNKMIALIEEGYELSKYIATIYWDGSPNTKEWLGDLEDRVESMQKNCQGFLSCDHDEYLESIKKRSEMEAEYKHDQRQRLMKFAESVIDSVIEFANDMNVDSFATTMMLIALNDRLIKDAGLDFVDIAP